VYRIFAVSIAVLIAISSCVRHEDKRAPSAAQNEYSQRYMVAMSTNDKLYIESTIAYMDKLIADGKSGIIDIESNKAELLFRLKRYDEAIGTLKSSQKIELKFDLAMLLLRLGHESEGRHVLEELLQYQEGLLLDPRVGGNDRSEVVKMKIMILHLLGRDTAAVLENAIRQHELTEKQVENLKEGLNVSPSQIEQTRWPD
jgi:tetratricopeptide (TPR) repeat protein